MTPTEQTALAAAIPAAQAAQRATGIPASVTLAQGIQESAWFTKTTGAFNYFGIKGAPGAPSVLCWTHEDNGTHVISCQAWFASYASQEDAFMAHAELLATSPAYAPAMAALPDVTGFCMGLRDYATDPAYCTELVALIAEEGLGQYDVAASPGSEPAPAPAPADPGDAITEALNAAPR